MKPSLILEQDSDWEYGRPVPTEPWRTGKIIVVDEKILTRYKELNQLITTNKVGAYFEPSITNQVIKDYKINLTDKQKRILEIARKVRDYDPISSYLIASLAFTEDIYSKIVITVHEKLVSSQLSANKEMVGKILNYFNSSDVEKYFRINSEKIIRIYDPFGGGGALSYLLAKQLDSLNLKFEILVGDIDSTGFEKTKTLLSKLSDGELDKFKTNINFVKSNGITMNEIPNNSIDFIISTLSLHEHSKEKVRNFFKNSLYKLKSKGSIIVVDATREGKIVKRAERLLPVLARYGAFRAGFNYLLKNGLDERLKIYVQQIINGSIYTTLSGIRSYQSGLTKEEYKIILDKLDKIVSYNIFYNYDGPIGSIQIVVNKK